MNTISHNMVSFKSVVINDDGLNYIKKYDGEKAVKLVTDAKEKYKQSRWKLIINQDGYFLCSPNSYKNYKGPFSVKKQHKKDCNNNYSDKLIIRTGKNNRIHFSIDYPSREAVFDIYKKIKNATGIKKIIMIFELLEKQSVLKKANEKIKSVLKRLA